ncbi:MAG: beta-alanine--pyruvate transaminase [Rhodospirillaceae bacterium]|jgi:beta-alanine--pyruvate transaminase|nr:beta-alanine--pyruvate transaminase [Rhodospirillaceae bacterium]
MPVAANSLENHWLPFTSNRDFKADPRLLVRAEGVYYWNHKGEKLIDASSGLFCCAAGHGRKEIADAVHKSMLEIDYTPHFQVAHPASFELARKVAKLMPGDLDYVFFCNSGSEAVDTAIKIALAYHRARGEGQRQRFISRERAYHGVNIGGVSLSGMVRNRETFGAVMPGVAHMRHTWLPENRFTIGQPEKGVELADDLQRFVDLYGASTIAACFVEPIAGSTGVLVPPKGYLERLRQICDRHGILLVFDEVICGFGRTGKAFAAESFGVVPDMITMAKALTNGAQPMGAVAASERIYATIVDGAAPSAVELFHGYTYSAHPAACAAGIAALDIYEREGLFERAAEMSPYFLERVFSLQGMNQITDIRGYGMLAGIELAPAERPGARGYEATKRLFAAGMHIKFTGDAGIVAPALVAEKKHIDEMCRILREVISAL